MDSIFPIMDIDRGRVRWEDHLLDLTPWENREGIWFKREDYFAPLGYGGPNGSKMRQLIHYISTRLEGKNHILSGASVQSPQLSMSTIVGAHYGLPSRLVVYSKPHTVTTHPNPAIAASFGAVFEYANGPYNPIIQKMVKDLAQPSSLIVEYGISVPHESNPAEDVLAFHEVGARQASEMPPEVKRLVIPAGSCNSLCSILLGLARDPQNLDGIFTIGIGPDKLDWVRQRMEIMGVDVTRLPFDWYHYSLHHSGYSTYSQKFIGENWAGIDFHPTYEAKMWRWLRENKPLPTDDSTGFWIVGSNPRPEVVKPFTTH